MSIVEAILNNDYEQCKALLSVMTDIELEATKVVPLNQIAMIYNYDYSKMPFLVWASIAAKPDIFQLILQVPRLILNPILEPQNQTPLYFVLNHLEVSDKRNAIMLIKDDRVNVNFQSYEKSSILHVLFKNRGKNTTNLYSKTFDILIVLLQRKDLNVNAQNNAGRTPLMEAILREYYDHALLLLNHSKVNLNLSDVNDQDAAFFARQSKNARLISFFATKTKFIDETKLESETLPPTFDIATSLLEASKKKKYNEYPRTWIVPPIEKSVFVRDFLLSPANNMSTLEALDYNNAFIGDFEFSRQKKFSSDKVVQESEREFKLATSIDNIFETAYNIYTGIDESRIATWPLPRKIEARKAYIVSMLQSFYDNFDYPEFLAYLKGKPERFPEWFYMTKYVNDLHKDFASRAVLRHKDGYPLIYMIYSTTGKDGVTLHGWVRSLRGTARSKSQNVSLGPMAFSLFIVILEAILDRPIHYVFMQSLLGTDVVLQTISSKIQNPLVLVSVTKENMPWYRGKETDCLIVTDELRNFYKRFLNAKEPSLKRQKAIDYCMACHIRAEQLYAPQGVANQVFCGQDCYEHYHGVHEYFLH